MPCILLTNYYADAPLAVVRSALPEGFTLLSLGKPGKEEILKHAPLADYLLVGGRVKIDREIIEAAPNLKMVQRTGVGLDSLDLELLKQRQIPIFVNAGINSRSVAEHTLMLILAVLRRLPVIDASVKSGEWKKHELGIQCHDLHGKTVGLIGLGSIGMTVARMLQPFGVNILYHKRSRLSPDEERELDLHYLDLEEVLAESDIISLHCPLTSATQGLIGPDQFALMKHGVILVNTARGRLVDEKAFVENLQSGKVSGAGLDVFASEPAGAGCPLLKLPNIVLSPHMSGLTIETFQGMMRAAFASISTFHKRNEK